MLEDVKRYYKIELIILERNGRLSCSGKYSVTPSRCRLNKFVDNFDASYRVALAPSPIQKVTDAKSDL